MNWTEAEHSDRFFGTLRGKSRLFQHDKFEMEGPGPEEDRIFLMAEKLKDLTTDSKFLDDEHIQSWGVSQNGGWTVEQTWGFEEIEGKRYYTRRFVVRKGDQVQRVRMVYDYKGPVNEPTKSDDNNDLAYGD